MSISDCFPPNTRTIEGIGFSRLYVSGSATYDCSFTGMHYAWINGSNSRLARQRERIKLPNLLTPGRPNCIYLRER